jgi:hypothetical protein
VTATDGASPGKRVEDAHERACDPASIPGMDLRVSPRVMSEFGVQVSKSG